MFTRKEISRMTARELNLTIEDTDVIIKTFVNKMAEVLAEEDTDGISIPGYGIFEKYTTAVRDGVGCFEGTEVGGNNKVKFKTSLTLERKLNNVE